jgi:hypothetical protein
MMNWKEFGRKLSWPNSRWICLVELRKITKTSVRIAGLRAEIWTRNIPNSKQECYPPDHDVRRFTWRWWCKPRQNSVRMAGSLAKIRNRFGEYNSGELPSNIVCAECYDRMGWMFTWPVDSTVQAQPSKRYDCGTDSHIPSETCQISRLNRTS